MRAKRPSQNRINRNSNRPNRIKNPSVALVVMEGFLFAPVFNNIEDFGGGLDEQFSAGGEQFVGGAVAPEAADGKHTGSDGGFHIGVCVAQIQELSGWDGETFCDLNRAGRVGFDRDIGQGALDDFESPLRKELFDDNFCKAVIFIGEDYHRQAALLERREKLRDAGIWFCGPAPAFIVDFFGEMGDGFDGFGIAGGFGQCAEGLCLDTVADKIFIRLNGMRRVAKVNEGFIHRVCNVGEGIKQRAIEVEENGFEHKRRMLLKKQPRNKLRG